MVCLVKWHEIVISLAVRAKIWESSRIEKAEKVDGIPKQDKCFEKIYGLAAEPLSRTE